MYVEIKDNKLLSWCENAYLDYEYVDIDYSTFNPEKYSVIDGVLTDITGTEEYRAKLVEMEKSEKSVELNAKIDELDKKRVRAIAEPELKDAESGETWLEYYTKQVRALRARIAAL